VELGEGVGDFEIGGDLAAVAEPGFGGVVELTGSRAGKSAAPEEPPGEDDFAEFLLLGFGEEVVNHAGVVIKVLIVELAGEAKLVLFAGAEVAVEGTDAIADGTADEGEKTKQAPQPGESDGGGAFKELEEREADAGERGENNLGLLVGADHDARAREERFEVSLWDILEEL
jgi:hypothetical protein